MHRFMHEYVRIQTLEGVARTKYDQYTSIIKPLQKDLETKGVTFVQNCQCIDILTKTENNDIIVTGFTTKDASGEKQIDIKVNDLMFFQNGSMTDGASIGSWTQAPEFKP